MPIIRLKEDTVTTLPIPSARDVYYWDSYTAGFGVRVYYNGNRVYVVRYQNDKGKQSLKTLGRVDHLSLQTARRDAHSFKRNPTKTTDKIIKRRRQSRPLQEIQCAYTEKGVHHFKSKREDAKYCCTEHYHLDARTYKYNNKPAPMKSYAPYNPTITTSPDVIYLPDETPEKNDTDFALLQHQLDEMNQNIEQIIEDKVNEKLQEMLETLTSNLFTLLTSKLGGP